MELRSIQKEDCERIGAQDFIDWESFRDARFLITGSTGLIGSNLVYALAYNNQAKNLGISLILPVRNVDRASDMFSWCHAQIVPYNLGDELAEADGADYIVHLASPTSSEFFSKCPADTILSNVQGTKALLDWSKQHQIRRFVYLSSMEVYGFPQKGHKVTEYEGGAFNSMNPRNSYPIAKIACEALCNSYYAQYDVPAVVLRATQTFGPGVKYDDGRVFAQFMRCAMEKKNIVLKSHGLTERSYLYTGDAVSAILVALLRGVPGQAYSVANPETYISIRDMAGLVADEIANAEIKVEYDIAEDIEKLGYAATLYMDLDVTKISGLGWKPVVALKEMFKRMIAGIDQ